MQVSLIDIGTSKGIRIPSSILKELNRPQKFDLRIERNALVLEVIEKPRKGWADKFKKSDSELLIDDALDMDEWDEI